MPFERHGPADIASDRLVVESITAPAGKRQEGSCEFMVDPDGHFLMLCARTARGV